MAKTNILLTGVGGQGTVLAAKLLAQAAQAKGWQVRTAETIGMAQRGGSVVSHVRMASEGDAVFAPLVSSHEADMIVAFEPAEAARVLPYLAPDGVMVCASTPIQPVTTALSGSAYNAPQVIDALRCELGEERLLVVDDAAVLERLGNRKALNTVLLASAIGTGHVPLTLDDLREAVRSCVKPRFIELNLSAIDLASGSK